MGLLQEVPGPRSCKKGSRALSVGRVTRGLVGGKDKRQFFLLLPFSTFTLTSLFATYVMISCDKCKCLLLRNYEFSRVGALYHYLYIRYCLKQPSDVFPNLQLPLGS